MSDEKNVLVDKNSEEKKAEIAKVLLNQLHSLQNQLNKMGKDFNNSAKLVEIITKNKLTNTNINLNTFDKSISEFIEDSETILEKNNKDIK